MSKVKDVISTPVPFPTLPVTGAPKSDRPWIQNNWFVLLIIECIVLFAAFVGLLVYYLFFVRTPGKRILDDKVDNDGLSHHGSDVSASSRSSSVASTKRSVATRRSFDGAGAPGSTSQGGVSRKSAPPPPAATASATASRKGRRPAARKP